MNDTQIIAIAIIFIAAIASVMFNNMRITDLRTDLAGRLTDTNKRIDDLRDSITKRIDDKFQLLMERLQRMEDNLTNQLANHEARIYKLEHPNER